MNLFERLRIFGRRLVRGWLPEESVASGQAPRPWWWKPIWTIGLLGCVVVALVDFYQGVPPAAIIAGAALFTVLFGSSFYIRVRANLSVNRAFWLFFGFCPIGFAIFVAEALAMKPFINIGSLPGAAGLPASIAPFAAGIYLGDWIGKRRNYRLPLSL